MIELKNVSKTYTLGNEHVTALKDVTLTIPDGKLVSIFGPSGSGKSTLLSILGCLDRPDSGDYILNGVNIASASAKERTKLRSDTFGFVFQSFNLIPHMDAFDNVMLPLMFKHVKKSDRIRTALSALESVGLADRLHHKPCEMSGGQQQRTAIARAVAGDPSIILADEPTGNLDRESAESILFILKKLVKQGKTVILITHDRTIAESADVRIRIENGYAY